MKRAVVVGGGFAGVAAACRLAGEGHRPLLLERAPRLGGRAASYADNEMGETVDYGHHVLMACCTATRGFLARISARDAVRFQPELRIPILCEGQTSLLQSSLLPGPLHLALSLLRYRPLTMRDHLGVMRAGVALLLRPGNGNETFRAWLDRQGQSEASIERLWNPISIATLNAPVERVGVSAARQVFREGFLAPGGANIGLFAHPLSGVFDRARTYLEQHEAEVRAGSGVSRILVEAHAVSGVELTDGEVMKCDAVVAAVPPDALQRILGDGDELAGILEPAARLEWSPIVDVHFWFDRPVMEEAFAMAIDSPIQAIFNLSANPPVDTAEESGTSSSPQLLRPKGRAAAHIVLSQSAADDWMTHSSEEIADLVLDALRALLPATREAACLHRRVIKHPRATFVPTPGSDALRPGARTPINGLFLAGDWTATGWPSTIEGAIRSGIIAAANVEATCETDDAACD